MSPLHTSTSPHHVESQDGLHLRPPEARGIRKKLRNHYHYCKLKEKRFVLICIFLNIKRQVFDSIFSTNPCQLLFFSSNVVYIQMITYGSNEDSIKLKAILTCIKVCLNGFNKECCLKFLLYDL